MTFSIKFVVLLQRSKVVSIDLILGGQSGVILNDNLHLSHLIYFTIVEIEFLQDGVHDLLVLQQVLGALHGGIE